MKKIFFISLLFLACCFSFANNSRVDFLKGNIIDKTVAVQEATGDEGLWLSQKAIEFALESRPFLENDRELDSLVIAAILSIPSDYFKLTANPQVAVFLNYFLDLFTQFADDSTVQITLLSKIVTLNDYVDLSKFVLLLNNYLTSVNPSSADAGVIKNVINTLESIGSNESFIVLYNCWNNKKYSAFNAEIEKALSSLSSKSANEIIQIIRCKDIEQIVKVFQIVQKNQKFAKNLLCQIAENSLSESILLLSDSSQAFNAGINEMQLNALEILRTNNWTRSSAVAINYFNFAKKHYDSKEISEDAFLKIIYAMPEVSPIESVNPLCQLLENCNNRTEHGENISSALVTALVKTLGAIGNKSAFDYLLAVTYLSYPDEVLSAAGEALAGLRWQ